MSRPTRDTGATSLQVALTSEPSVNEVVEASLHCMYKAHLRLRGQSGTKCDYETMYRQLTDNVKRMASENVVDPNRNEDVQKSTPLNRSVLKLAVPFILDAQLPTDLGVLHFDGLKKVAGASRLGEFHYMPLLFHGGSKAHKEQKALLELCGLFLSELQGRMPSRGGVYCGKDCRLATVRLSSDSGKIRRVIEGVERLRSSLEPPLLILNDHCNVCEFRQPCHQQAMEQGNLSLLGIGEKEIKTYARKGILTLTQLAHTFRPRRKGKRTERSKRRYHALQAMAIRDKTVFILGTPTLPTSPVKVYLDVEGDPDEGYIYLIGIVVCDGVSEHSHSFWADTKDQEIVILQQFLQAISHYDECHIFCYGEYDKAFLRKMRSKVTGKKRLDRVLGSLTNVLSVVYSHIYFPCYTNGLKDVASSLGYSWSDKAASGIQSIVWRKRWDETHDEAWKQGLVTYNLEDCHALKRVTEFLYVVAARASSSGESPVNSDSGKQPPIMWVQDIDNRAYTRRWGEVDFFHPEYEYINRCAYFDYQRQRVFVRTSKTIRKRARKSGRKGFHNRKLRASRHIRITASKCPTCKSRDLLTLDKTPPTLPRKPRGKRSFDLVLTPGGIKRKVIECRAVVQQCRQCGEVFVPPNYERLDKHWHGLKSWAMFQHVAYGTSFGVLEEMLWEFFDLCVHDPEVHMFKSLLAHYYKPTHRNLLKKILSGPVIHIDDTEVKLKTGKGCVTVITSLEEVVFLYRPTKEGSFVLDLLKDFHGVLVSDFHPSYDSVPCPQQKCLIHLMRDINQDLLNNPFDQELQMISGPFGTLLQSVVKTVDQYGLKRRYLRAHARDVVKFFEFVSTLSVQSDAARGLQDRFVKCRDKLFTFIKYDGVPWNNNNAENAIKRFAYYREDTAGTMKEQGLSDYLVLLSIYQTCRYKGVSFLKFLLSRERNLDAFCEGRRKKRRPPLVETYPKDFTPPHLLQLRKWQASKGQPFSTPRDTESTPEDQSGPAK